MSIIDADAEQILKFMAFNGLVANPTETLLVVNNRVEEEVKLNSPMKKQQSS